MSARTRSGSALHQWWWSDPTRSVAQPGPPGWRGRARVSSLSCPPASLLGPMNRPPWDGGTICDADGGLSTPSAEPIAQRRRGFVARHSAGERGAWQDALTGRSRDRTVPRMERRLTPRGRDRRRQLMAVATELFARSGYDPTSVGDIVSALGVGKGVFYWYFSSKEE